MERPAISPGKEARCVARTQDILQAERIAKEYELQGFEAWITKKGQGGITIYEVWTSKDPDVKSVEFL
ncbi:MAG: hypothetical protein V1827_00515 [Candidatus Micrarchaeota archaeon]